MDVGVLPGGFVKTEDLILWQNELAHKHESARSLRQLAQFISDWLIRHIFKCNVAVLVAGEEKGSPLMLAYYHAHSLVLFRDLERVLLNDIVGDLQPDNAIHISSHDFRSIFSLHVCDHFETGTHMLAYRMVFDGHIRAAAVLFGPEFDFSKDDAKILETGAGLFPSAVESLILRMRYAEEQRRQRDRDPADFWKDGTEYESPQDYGGGGDDDDQPPDPRDSPLQ